MRQLLIILLLSTIGYSQTVDSVQIIHPNTYKHLRTIYSEHELREQLNKVNERYRTDLFILKYFISDKTMIIRKVRKDRPIEQII